MINKIAETFLILGGLNWGLIGITSFFGNRFDLVEWITADVLNLGVQNFLGNILYLIVGISVLVYLFNIIISKRVG